MFMVCNVFFVANTCNWCDMLGCIFSHAYKDGYGPLFDRRDISAMLFFAWRSVFLLRVVVVVSDFLIIFWLAFVDSV